MALFDVTRPEVRTLRGVPVRVRQPVFGRHLRQLRGALVPVITDAVLDVDAPEGDGTHDELGRLEISEPSLKSPGYRWAWKRRPCPDFMREQRGQRSA